MNNHGIPLFIEEINLCVIIIIHKLDNTHIEHENKIK